MHSIQSLYVRYGPIIFSRCLRLLRNPTDAEDATQEVFLRLTRHSAALENEGEAVRWVHRVATNHCLNLKRNGKKFAGEPVPELGVSTEHELMCRDLFERMLTTAPKNVRAVAQLHYAEGMAPDEVAELLGVSRRTVFNHLSRFADWGRRRYAEVA